MADRGLRPEWGHALLTGYVLRSDRRGGYYPRLARFRLDLALDGRSFRRGSPTKFSGCKRLATEMSSSIASQCTPIPPPINSQSDRCRGDASASRGNPTSGTETTRPSVSVTESASFEHDTSTAKASVFSAKVFIPSLQEQRRIFSDDFSNFGHFMRTKTPHVGDRYGIYPKLSIAFGLGNVDVRWFQRFPAEKKEPIPPHSENNGHFPSLPPQVGQDSGDQVCAPHPL